MQFTDGATVEGKPHGSPSLLLKMLEQVRAYEPIDAVANDVGTIKGDIRILREVDGQCEAYCKP